jgi:hypothetical protein
LNPLLGPERVAFEPPSPDFDTRHRDFGSALRSQHDAQVQDAVLLGSDQLFPVEQKDSTAGAIDSEQAIHRTMFVWQYLRENWLSSTVFENYDAIVDAACEAWRKLIAQPETITSIGMRDWAHIGQLP